MFEHLKLRWKLLVALIGVSVIPLAVSLLLVSTLADRQLESEQRSRIEVMGGLIERGISQAQTERANYIRLIAGEEDLQEALRSAAPTGDTSRLDGPLRNLGSSYHFDRLEVFDRDGRRIWHRQSAGGAAGREDAATAPKRASDRLILVGGRLAMTAAAPVTSAGEILGSLVGITFVDENFLLHTFGSDLESLRLELAFYGPQGIFTATRSTEGLDLAAIIGGVQEISLGDKSYSVFSRPLEVDGYGMLVFLDRSGLIGTSRNFREILVAILIVITALAIAVGLGVATGIVRPLARIGDNLREIAEGEGDLTRELRVRSRDEIGDLASNFNRFLARMREMVRRTRAVAADVGGATEQVRQASRQVNDGAVRQSGALEECHRAMEGIRESAAGIAESTGTLLDSSEASSSATLELGATIEEIAGQMEKLFGIVEEVTSSINEMSVASQQIMENVDILASSMETTASSVTEMDATIKEVEENADRTSRLAEAAAADALDGKAAVDQTIQGIGEIRASVDVAATVIHNLGQQSKSIGKILTVIDEVADQTGLLALNAAIIAAQAGEHGRGFAVVADEIRELAERTAVSTREIAAIIGNLQAGTEDAVRAMAAGSARVHEEVARSRNTGEALEKIRASTLNAASQVRGIVRATQEQSRGSRQITGAINQVSSMLGQIATAIRQQTTGAQQLSRAAEGMKEIASQGKVGTGEQAKGSRQISQSMDQIRTMIERIDGATRALNERSGEVVEAVSMVRQIAGENAGRTAELDKVVDILSRQSAALKEEVGAFTA